MRHKYIALTILFLLMVASTQGQHLKTKSDSVSYAAGISIATSFQKHGVEKMDVDLLTKAVRDVFLNDSTALWMGKKEGEKLFNQYITDIKSRAGRDFLMENAKKPGVVTLPSGLQYKVVVKGDKTQKPTPKDIVKTHYHGTLIDGTIFDSTREKDSPATFPLHKVIKGWVEGIQLMSVGDKFVFYVPYELAYGERGAGSKIGPYATLIFEVELLDIISEQSLPKEH